MGELDTGLSCDHFALSRQCVGGDPSPVLDLSSRHEQDTGIAEVMSIASVCACVFHSLTQKGSHLFLAWLAIAFEWCETWRL